MHPHAPASGAGGVTYAPLSGITQFGAFAILAAFGICALAYLDPQANSWGLGGIRFAVTGLFIAGGLLLLIEGAGSRAFSNHKLWALLIFFTWEAVGSVLWIEAFGGQFGSSYLTRAANGFAIIAGVTAASNPALLSWICRNAMRIWLAAALIIAALLTIHSVGFFLPLQRQVYHVEFVVAVAVLSFFVNSRGWVGARLFLTFICILNGFLAGKSTFYLLAIVVLLMGFGGPAMARLRQFMLRSTAKARVTIGLLVAPIFLSVMTVGIITIGWIVAERSTRYEYDPRRVSYALRWDQFLEDPILGKLFVDTTDVGRYIGMRNVPSHNDLLDILAAGGIVGFLLFLIPVASAILGKAGQSIISRPSFAFRYSDFLWYFLVFYAISAMGNPFLAEPVFAGPIWFAVGAMLVRNRQFAESESLATKRHFLTERDVSYRASKQKPA